MPVCYAGYINNSASGRAELEAGPPTPGLYEFC